MSAGLPEGVELSVVQSHALNMSAMVTMINLTGAYLTAEKGTQDEHEAEQELDEYLGRIVEFGPERAGGILLAFASLVVQACDEPTVQKWIDEQSGHVAAALGLEVPGD